jgi:hypothetical protein
MEEVKSPARKRLRVTASTAIERVPAEEDSEADTTDGGLGLVPALHDIKAWRAFTNDAALQAMWTPRSNEKNFHPLPRYHRTRTNFDDEVHEYYFDDVHVNKPGDPDAWPSPSSIHVFAEFEGDLASRNVAMAGVRGVLLNTIVDLETLKKEKLPSPKLPELWKMLVEEHFEHIELLDKIWDDICALCRFTIPGSVISEAASAFRAGAADWAKLPEADRTAYADMQRIVIGALAAEALAKWNHARTSGSEKHEGFDYYCQHLPVPDGITIPLGFKRAMAWIAVRYDVVGTEIPMADEDVRVVGATDLILRDRKTGKILIADFKNCACDDLADSGDKNKFGIHPFTRHLTGTKFNKYVFQLSFYRHIFERKFFPGEMAMEGVIINIDPRNPDAAQIYIIQLMDMAPFWVYLAQRLDKSKPPGEQQSEISFASHVPTLVPTFPDSDPRCKGPTTSVRLQRNIAALAPSMVWCGRVCKSAGYPPLERSEWAHPDVTWFGKPDAGVASSYEVYLLTNPKLLLKLPTLIGKQIVCWCFPDFEHKCNGEVLAKYANLLKNGAFDLSQFAGLSSLEVDVYTTTLQEKMDEGKPQRRGTKRGEARAKPLHLIELVRITAEVDLV